MYGVNGEKGETGAAGPQGPPGPRSGGVTYVRWGRTTCPNNLDWMGSLSLAQLVS